MDEDIMNAVESLFGKDVKVVDCQTSSTVQQEEVLLINGVPVKLDGLPADDASAIKSALLDGQMPAVEHLNQLLFRAGLAQQPIEVETSLTVKSSLTTTEEVLVSRNGQVLDERTVETKEHFNHQSHQKEIWQPIKQENALARATPENALKYRTNSNSTCTSQATTTDPETETEMDRPGDPLGRQLNQTFSNASIMSTSSAITCSDQLINSASNISTATTTMGDKSSNLSSCDSGHDGLFHSVSMSAPYTQCDARDPQTDSMYCDIPSSADEADVVSVAVLSTHLKISEQCDAAKDCQTSLPVYAKDLPATGNLDTLAKLLAKPSNEDIEFSLLLCARLFIQMQVLLARLVEEHRGREEQLLRLLGNWSRLCPHDFRNETLLQELRKQNHNKAISAFLDTIADTLAQLDTSRRCQLQYLLSKQSSASSLGRQSSIKSLKRFATNVYKTDNVLNKCSNAFELAHQLYAIEYAYLSQIRLEEFVEMISAGEFKSCMSQKKASTLGCSSSSSAKQPEVNIAAYVQWFNQLCSLIATEIVKLGKKSQRAQMIEFWIDTALECFNTGNFNSLMAILTALNTTPITRLKKTWAKVQRTKFEGLEHQMDPSGNYQNYRSTMKAAVWRSEREEANKIERAIIPYFSLFLKDFNQIHEQHETKLVNGFYNFEKCALFGAQLRNFYNWQRLDCPYEQLSNVVGYLQKAEAFTADQLMKASYECEQPDGTQEKEHYKTLKAAK
ncbi:ras-GEF domain-containing family member 1C isoform X1 [Drosophila sulfurigaster albostrigata]|uniref:ras-GEF domain-containing family member 1C isoform X1 n=2 Tax=Drosophila sulfurigaster albostrigata TaxID=89887 RepID=UPI002D21A42E|nr:ras-GEF domain-containing family member 1C isoform X1 [Drosophila sulfurigaster albostrigata]